MKCAAISSMSVLSLMVLLTSCGSDGGSATTSESVVESTAVPQGSLTVEQSPVPTSTLPERDSPATRERFLAYLSDDSVRATPGIWEIALEQCSLFDQGWKMFDFFDLYTNKGEYPLDLRQMMVLEAAATVICPEYLGALSEN
jgi:hypothetical protein